MPRISSKSRGRWSEWRILLVPGSCASSRAWSGSPVLLFAVVNLCRKSGVHAALALDKANAKFTQRFSGLEALAAERGIDVRTAGLETLDALDDARAYGRFRRDELGADDITNRSNKKDTRR